MKADHVQEEHEDSADEPATEHTLPLAQIWPPLPHSNPPAFPPHGATKGGGTPEAQHEIRLRLFVSLFKRAFFPQTVLF